MALLPSLSNPRVVMVSFSMFVIKKRSILKSCCMLKSCKILRPFCDRMRNLQGETIEMWRREAKVSAMCETERRLWWLQERLQVEAV